MRKVKFTNGNAMLKRTQLIWSPRWKGPVRIRLHSKQSMKQVLITQFFKKKVV